MSQQCPDDGAVVLVIHAPCGDGVLFDGVYAAATDTVAVSLYTGDGGRLMHTHVPAAPDARAAAEAAYADINAAVQAAAGRGVDDPITVQQIVSVITAARLRTSAAEENPLAVEFDARENCLTLVDTRVGRALMMLDLDGAGLDEAATAAARRIAAAVWKAAEVSGATDPDALERLAGRMVANAAGRVTGMSRPAPTMPGAPRPRPRRVPHTRGRAARSRRPRR